MAQSLAQRRVGGRGVSSAQALQERRPALPKRWLAQLLHRRGLHLRRDDHKAQRLQLRAGRPEVGQAVGQRLKDLSRRLCASRLAARERGGGRAGVGCPPRPQRSHDLLPHASPQLEEHKRILVEAFAQQVGDGGDVLARVGIVGAGTVGLQVAPHAGEQAYPGGGESLFDVGWHLAGQQLGGEQRLGRHAAGLHVQIQDLSAARVGPSTCQPARINQPLQRRNPFARPPGLAKLLAVPGARLDAVGRLAPLGARIPIPTHRSLTPPPQPASAAPLANRCCGSASHALPGWLGQCCGAPAPAWPHPISSTIGH